MDRTKEENLPDDISIERSGRSPQNEIDNPARVERENAEIQLSDSEEANN